MSPLPSRLLVVASLLLAPLAVPIAIAQSGGYQIEGNSLLPPNTVSLTVMPFTGPKSSFETIQLALEALEKAYLGA